MFFHVPMVATSSLNFYIEVGVCRRSSLKFILDGEDQTCQEIRMTQSRIDELL